MGKTLVCEAIAYRLLREGFKVFRYEKEYDTLPLELEAINKEDKPVIILESYTRNKQFLENLRLLRSNRELVLIVSERTALYETTFQTLQKLIDFAEVELFDVNDLEHDDIVDFIRVLDAYGLWGDSEGKPFQEKFWIMEKDCHRTIREVLLHILDSKDIMSRFQVVIEALNEKKQYYQAIILLLSANRFNVPIDISYINQVLNTQNIRTISFETNLAIKELIDLEGGTIKVRSSIIAEALLERVSDVVPIINTFIETCRVVDDWEDETSMHLKKEYVSYGNLRWLCQREGQDVNDIIAFYYDKIRNFESCKSNPHFWLQYAMMEIDKGLFDIAKQHLDAAYAMALRKRSNFDTYQIDNQAANLTLKKILAQTNILEALKQFKEAHRTLTRHTDPNRLRHYPYKVAEQYVAFHERFFAQIPNEEKPKVVAMYDEMVRRMDDYLNQPAIYRVKNYVRRTRNQLGALISDFKSSQKN